MLLDEYKLTQFLGKGTFGEVYLTTKQNTDFLFATKRMAKEMVEDPKYYKYFQNEISILKRLYHKNIVRLEGLKKTNNHYYVIMEYCNGGSLTDCLEKYKNLYHRPFTEEIVQHIMRQIVSAINYIHSLRIIHRDLKLDNILVKFENEIDKNQVNLLKAEVKIIDFGFAAYKDQSGLLSTAIGSPMNMDPLILKKFNGGNTNKELGYDEKADIWSLGTLCYQMLIGSCAFDAYNMKELVSKIEEGTYKVPTNLSKEVVSFLNAMLQYNPQKRLGASDLIKHAFLIKNVSDFTRIDMSKVSKKVYGGELKINIRDNNTIWSIFNVEDEQRLNNIPGELFPKETPISESQYLGNLNGNNQQLISKEPFNVDKNFMDKEFKIATSMPINGLQFGMNNKTMPISELNQEPQNMPGNTDEIEKRNNLATPMKQNAASQIPIFQKNINNNLLNLRTPQRLGVNRNNNMITIISKLDNGQILKTEVPVEKIQQQLNKNGLIGNNQVNVNLINKFQQAPGKENNPNNLPQNNPSQNKLMNAIQHPQMNLPHGQIQFPHGPIMNPHMGIPQIHQINPNLMMGNQIQPNQIRPNQIPNNQLINLQIPNNQIQNNQMNNNLLRNNNIINKENQNNLIQAQKNQVSNNTVKNNQLINNPNGILQNKLIPNNQIPTNTIQNKQIPFNKIPQSRININKNQNSLTPLRNITPNRILPINNMQMNLKNNQNLNINKPNQLNRAITQKENNMIQIPRMNRARSPIIGKLPINNFQTRNPQILLKNANPNQINSPFNGQMNLAQQIKPIPTPSYKYSERTLQNRIPGPEEINKNANNSPKKMIQKINTALGIKRQLQKIPLDNVNRLPNQGGQGIPRIAPVPVAKQIYPNQLSNYELAIKNRQNNLITNQNYRNRISPQKIGVRPTLNFPNNNNMKLIPVNH